MDEIVTFTKLSTLKAFYKVFYLSIFILAILLYGCGPSAGFFNLVNNVNPVTFNNTKDSLPNGRAIDISEITLEQSAKIQDVDYDDSLKAVLVNYSKGDNSYLHISNPNDNSILWEANSNMSVSVLQDNDLILREPKGSEKLYEATSGQFIRNIESYLYVLGDGQTLQLSPDKFASIDLETGKRYWEGPGEKWVGYREQYIDGDWCYVVAEGLHAINIDEGEKWKYMTPTSYTNVGKELVKEAALSCLFALGGGYHTSSYKPDVTMNMNSQPSMTENEIYFAARDKIVCLDKSSGRLVWETQIDPELESMSVYDISETEIALIGNGIKMLNFVIQKSNPPSIRIIQKNDGNIAALYSMNDDAVVQDFASTGEYLYLLIPNQLLIFDYDLNLIGIAESQLEYGDFITILSIGDKIVIRTSKGILGLSNDTFSEQWFRYCELPPVEESEDWKIPIKEQTKMSNQSLFNDNFYWTPNESDGITAFDTTSWEEITKVPLLSNKFKVVNGKYIDFLNNKIKIISF